MDTTLERDFDEPATVTAIGRDVGTGVLSAAAFGAAAALGHQYPWEQQ